MEDERFNTPRFEFTAEAEDHGAGVGSVSFYYRSTSQETFRHISTDFEAPFEANWRDITLPDGAYELRIEIQDRAGNQAEQQDVFVELDTASPQLIVVWPTPDERSYTPDPQPGFVVAAVEEQPAETPILVEFLFSARSTLPQDPLNWRPSHFSPVSTATQEPFAIDWGGETLPDGSYVLAARARDEAGNWSDLVWVSITVDSSPPELDLFHPLGSLSDLTEYTLRWTVQDASPVATVSLEVQESETVSWRALGLGLPVEGSMQWLAPNYPLREAVRFRLTARDYADNEGELVTPWVPLVEQPVPVSNLQLFGPIDLSSRFDARDLVLAWRLSPSSDVISQEVYVLRVGRELDLSTHVPLDSLHSARTAWSGDEWVRKDSAGLSLDLARAYNFWIVAIDLEGETAVSAPVTWSPPGT
jgi:hypothetical protein